MKRVVVVALLASSLALTAAHADTIFWQNFGLTNPLVTGEGYFTTVRDGDNYILTDVSGEIGGNQITGLSGYGSADNRLYGIDLALSFAGIAVVTDGPGNLAFKIFRSGDVKLTADSGSDPTAEAGLAAQSVFGAYLFDSQPDPVPEPATWALMIAGFGSVGLGMRRHSTKAAAFRSS